MNVQKLARLLKDALYFLEWETTDEGTPSQGWKSDKLENLIVEIKNELGIVDED